MNVPVNNNTNIGWLTVIGWQATFATSCYLVGTLIQGLVVLTNKNYAPEDWHGTLLYWAVVALSVAINSVGGKVLPRFEGMILILHILGFFAILIPLTYMADHGTSEEVFTQFLNLGEFPSQGLSFFVGTVGCIFAFAGGDAAVHVRLRYPGLTLTYLQRLFLRCLKRSQMLQLLFRLPSCSVS